MRLCEGDRDDRATAVSAPLVSKREVSSMAAVVETTVTREWLRDVLAADGYDVTLPAEQVEAVYAKHPSRPNIVCLIKQNWGILEFITFYKAQPGKEKQLHEAVEKANETSPFATFYIDKDGDMAISSYIVLVERGLTEGDVTRFLAKTAENFWLVSAQADLKDVVQ
jgi:Putative bacterial sensory transduction regulator